MAPADAQSTGDADKDKKIKGLKKVDCSYKYENFILWSQQF